MQIALQKAKTLPSGETGDYWRVSYLTFVRKGMKVDLVLALYKSAAVAATGAPPLPASYSFSFPVTQQELMGNIVSTAYTKVKALVAELHKPIIGDGEAKSIYPDLVGAVDV